METIRRVSSGCWLKTKLSQRMPQCDGLECLLRYELWLCSVVRRRKMEEASFCGRFSAVSYWLNTFRTQRDSTNKQHLFYTHKSTSLGCSIGSIFYFYRLCLGYFKIDPVVPSRCHPGLIVRLLLALWKQRGCRSLVGSACSGLFRSRSTAKLPRPAGGAGWLQAALDPDQVLMSGFLCWLTHQRRALRDRDRE